jgi:hypothetical protein
MRNQAELGNEGQLRATAAELQEMADLIQKYPAEAQLIMAALEDGLRLGPMQAMEAESNRVPHVSRAR